MIEKFQVLKNKPNLQNAKINHACKIGFSLASKVSMQNENVKITENGFDFICFKDICMHDPTFVVDILGEVQTPIINIDWVEFKNSKVSKSDVIITDTDGTRLTCVLWGSFADQLKSFMDSKSKEDKETVIIALQFAMISKFKGETKVSTMKNATRFFIRPDIQEVKNFIQSLTYIIQHYEDFDKF
ncbi:uncharacterized protein LOC130988947 [Salvia miltiorrhiza]|uniref:uncharacterized protein LOC130988947 n=1 Tax=Salvia miltiorrhiza TaxID=226208 RepID=UPI0025ACEAA5|nr:uncharacterized protein LOC130988947 [Salvia miltiorrhiza]